MNFGNFGAKPAATASASAAAEKQLELRKHEMYEQCIKSIDFQGLAREREAIVKTFLKTSQQNELLKELLSKVEALNEDEIQQALVNVQLIRGINIGNQLMDKIGDQYYPLDYIDELMECLNNSLTVM